MTTPDPLLERLRRLPRAPLDDVAAARTLARAEAAFASADTMPRAATRDRACVTRAWVPAALALWGALYAWGAVRELGRLFPRGAGAARGGCQPPRARRFRYGRSVHVERHQQGEGDDDGDDDDRAAPP